MDINVEGLISPSEHKSLMYSTSRTISRYVIVDVTDQKQYKDDSMTRYFW